MTTAQAIIIAIIEGLTEFLPISSTGHMIITQWVLGMKPDAFSKAFTVAIQFGAILSVVVLYFKRFFQSINFYFKLLAAFIPAVVVALLFKKQIDALLESVTTVAWALLLGGIVLVFIDKMFPEWKKDDSKPLNTDEMSWMHAFTIGVFQCIAMIPGVSRSAATIIGGMTGKFTRRQAAEFSFFLAVPTMFAATVKEMYDLYKESPEVLTSNVKLLVIGNAVAFVVAMLAIKFFIGVLNKYGFKAFGYYRIVVGAALLIMLALGVNLQLAE